MKNILITTIAALGLSLTVAQAADYTVFKVCQDQRIIRTSDGADAGHVDYIVVDPASHEVVSTVITGGVLAERHVAIPISSFAFGGEREVTLREITRERIASAPVIETTRFSSSYVVQPDVIERSYTHFGVNVNEINRGSTRTTVGGGPDRVGARATVGDQTTTDRTRAEGRVGTDGADRTRTTTGTTSTGTNDRTRANAERPGSTTTGEPSATADRPGSTNREGTRATDPTTGKHTGNPDAKAGTTGTTNKDGSAADRTSEKTGSKAGTASEKSAEQPGRKSEKAPLKSESNTEKGPAKPETSTEKGSSKPEASTDRPASHTEGSAEKSGTTKHSEKGESKGEASGARKTGTAEGSATAPAGDTKRAQ